MKKISWVTHPQYDIPLPKNHKFTSSKFSDLLSELEKSGLSEYANIFYPKKAAKSDLLKVHDRNYIDKILSMIKDPHKKIIFSEKKKFSGVVFTKGISIYRH